MLLCDGYDKDNIQEIKKAMQAKWQNPDGTLMNPIVIGV